MRLLSKRAREVGHWFLSQSRPCPKGYGMSLDFSPTDTKDMQCIVLAGMLWDQRTKKRRARKNTAHTETKGTSS